MSAFECTIVKLSTFDVVMRTCPIASLDLAVRTGKTQKPMRDFQMNLTKLYGGFSGKLGMSVFKDS